MFANVKKRGQLSLSLVIRALEESLIYTHKLSDNSYEKSLPENPDQVLKENGLMVCTCTCYVC